MPRSGFEPGISTTEILRNRFVLSFHRLGRLGLPGAEYILLLFLINLNINVLGVYKILKRFKGVYSAPGEPTFVSYTTSTPS
jgi:hypothetical protein